MSEAPFIAICLALLGLVAWRDFATRSIPDGASLTLALAGVSYRLQEGWHASAISIAIAFALFVVLSICHGRGWIGGGDVKLLCALMLGLSPLEGYYLIVFTALVGGLLAVAYLVLRRVLTRTPPARRRYVSLFRRVATIESWRIRRSGPLPYGIAIAVSGALVLLYFPRG